MLGILAVEVTLVNRDNFFLFTPMLHEVAASDLDVTTIVNPIRKVLRHVHFFVGQVEKIDLEQKSVIVSHGFDRHQHALSFDFLVVSIGSVTNFHDIPGLEQRALTMKTLGDAIRLRNHIIAHLEEAESDCCMVKETLLTFVVAGGGFAGVETVAAINDFARRAHSFVSSFKRADAAFCPCSSWARHPARVGRQVKYVCPEKTGRSRS